MTVEDGCRLVCLFAVVLFTNLTFHAHVPLANLFGRLAPMIDDVCFSVCELGPLFCEDQIAWVAGGLTSEEQSACGSARMMVVCSQKQSLFRKRGKIHDA